MALLHDMAECIVGDITPHDNVSRADKHRMEKVVESYFVLTFIGQLLLLLLLMLPQAPDDDHQKR